MKSLSRLTVLIFIIFVFIQYYISLRIDAGIGERLNGGYSGVQTGMGTTLGMVLPGSATESLTAVSAKSGEADRTTMPANSNEQAGLSDPGKPANSVNSSKPSEYVASSITEDKTDVTFPVQVRPKDKLTPYMKVPYFKSGKIGRYFDYMQKNPVLSCETSVVRVNIGIDRPFYSEINVIGDPGSQTVLVNKYNKLPDDYVPTLKILDPSCCVPLKGGQSLQPEAADAFMRLFCDAASLGLYVPAYGTYRSIPAQDYIWNREIKEGKTPEEIDFYHARGGFSEHNTGLAIDIIGTGYGISGSKEYAWYKENAHKYGFILRYELGMESITGYKYEPWHLRYVGVETAAAVYESGLTYDEYYTRNLSPY